MVVTKSASNGCEYAHFLNFLSRETQTHTQQQQPILSLRAKTIRNSGRILRNEARSVHVLRHDE